MMSARITLDNTSKAKRAVREGVKDAEAEAAEVGRANSVAICPVGEGQYGTHLFQTIRVEVQPTHHDLIAGDPSRNVRHTGWVEFGTEKTSAQPFMSPSIPLIKTELVASATRNIRKRLG